MVTSTTTTIINEPLPNQIVLKKTAKEKVGTQDIGAALAGAKFRLVTVNSDGTLGNVVPLVKLKNKHEYEYKPNNVDTLAVMTASGEYETVESNGSETLGEYNIMTTDTPPVYDMTKALVTGSNGKLKVENLPYGDYCLEEIQAPVGYAATDSHTGENRKVFFSVGKNTVIKNITCADERLPAYIKLYEHIDEWHPDEWGNPTFVFKIKQTGYYDYTGETPVITNTSGQEILVALTVDDDGKYTAGLVSHDNPSYDYTEWYQESTDEQENGKPEYLGQFGIDADGCISLEPGQYEITRMPVSRYTFVENTYTLDNDVPDTYENHRTETEKLVVTIPAERTAIVHYYDKVDYYDKFSDSDTEINQFYALDSNTKASKTVKGIRIADYHQTGTEGEYADTLSGTMTVPVTRLTIYKIYADGSEEPMLPEEYAALSSTNFAITYTYDAAAGDAESFGHAAAPATNDFSYNSVTKTITVNHISDYENGVYTLNVDYKGFKTAFDLVFLRSSS